MQRHSQAREKESAGALARAGAKLLRELCRELHSHPWQTEQIVHDKVHEVVEEATSTGVIGDSPKA